VGRDIRLSSPALAAAFIHGCVRAGGEVTDFGLVSTPCLYFGIIQGKFQGGAMITASHLPPHENGIKLCRENAIPLSGDKGLPELRRRVMETTTAGTSLSPAGSCRTGNLAESYLGMLAGFVRDPVSLTIAIDAGDGMAGPEVGPLFRQFPVLSTVTRNLHPDGRFPHHGANPLLSGAAEGLRETVRESHADFGVAFDGDADRCLFVDEHGELIPADLITALIAEYYLARVPGAAVLYDLRSSRVVAETISSGGGRGVRCRVGHAFIKEQMRREDAIFAGELSGHYYFRDAGFCDNGLLAMIQVINLLSAGKRPLSERVLPLRKYFPTGEINIRLDHPAAAMAALETAYAGSAIDHLDGLTVQYPAWWFNLRGSNTEPVVRLNLEAETEACRDRKKTEVLRIIREADPSAMIANG
jgi:phosphomannomutase